MPQVRPDTTRDLVGFLDTFRAGPVSLVKRNALILLHVFPF